ncbi:uncharacterized protein EDB91DRAFT_1237807 [Suillus paluster]|uniref:uncharacterized protein n=1 Tax=Suillus paluster TaxID=48578 RepID=UPI001B85FD90|nr:uncharacterized protein EDB91DRAFT_1237807 [Suillus paluster]KAG1738152.1 hypothetical protein EDB91DRAFT_1237807 [Suillus paluster]
MSTDENNPSGNLSRKCCGSALQMGPCKKVVSLNPLVLQGQHFGQMVFALFNYPALLMSGILRLEESQDFLIEDYPAEVFMELLDSYPGLLDRLMNREEEDIIHVRELSDWGFNHEVTGALLCPAGLDWSNMEMKESLKSGETAVRGDQWPIFLYAGYGLLRSDILIFVFKHVFTSPSLVDKEPKATCSGNVYLHGMKSVTKGSLAYIATQSVFSHTDTVMDSENFYHSILDLLEDPDESEEVGNLMMCHVFPNSSSSQCSISKNSALLKICEKCAALQEQVTSVTN